MFSDLTDFRIEGWAYAEQPAKFYECLGNGSVKFKGDDGTHYLTEHDGEWHCDCAEFDRLARGKYRAVFCPHTLGLERALPSIKPVPLDDLPELFSLSHKEAPCSL
jgi:hypothetical protein